MTTAEEELQKLAAASFGAWVQVTNACMDAADKVWTAVTEWAYDEVLLDPAFCGDAVVQVDADSPLRAVLTHVFTGEEVAAEVVTLVPDAAKGGAPAVVSVRVAQGQAVPSGVYRGHLVDHRDNVVSNVFNVTVLCG
jgi:hypothetical protein